LNEQSISNEFKINDPVSRQSFFWSDSIMVVWVSSAGWKSHKKLFQQGASFFVFIL